LQSKTRMLWKLSKKIDQIEGIVDENGK